MLTKLLKTKYGRLLENSLIWFHRTLILFPNNHCEIMARWQTWEARNSPDHKVWWAYVLIMIIWDETPLLCQSAIRPFLGISPFIHSTGHLCSLFLLWVFATVMVYSYSMVISSLLRLDGTTTKHFGSFWWTNAFLYCYMLMASLISDGVTHQTHQAVL